MASVISKKIRPALDWAAVKGSFVLDSAAGRVSPRLGVVPQRDHVETLFALHCRDLVREIDALPPDEQPDGWAIGYPDFLVAEAPRREGD